MHGYSEGLDECSCRISCLVVNSFELWMCKWEIWWWSHMQYNSAKNRQRRNKIPINNLTQRFLREMSRRAYMGHSWPSDLQYQAVFFVLDHVQPVRNLCAVCKHDSRVSLWQPPREAWWDEEVIVAAQDNMNAIDWYSREIRLIAGCLEGHGVPWHVENCEPWSRYYLTKY